MQNIYIYKNIKNNEESKIVERHNSGNQFYNIDYALLFNLYDYIDIKLL